MPKPPKSDPAEDVEETIKILEQRAVIMDQAVMIVGQHLAELQAVANAMQDPQQQHEANLQMAQTVIAMDRLIKLHEVCIQVVQKLRARGRIATPDLSLIGPDGRALHTRPKSDRRPRKLTPIK